MKALLVITLVATGAPALAASSNDTTASQSQHRVCTRLQQRGGSRISERRVCLTENEWRERLGPDWRMALSGRTPEDDMESLEARSQSFSNINGEGISTSSIGQRGGGPSPQ